MSWKQLQAKAEDFLFNYEALEKQQDLFSGALLKLAFKEENLDVNKIEKAILEDKKVESDLAKAKFLLAFQFNDYLDMYRRRTQERIGLYVKETYNEGTGEYDLDSYEIPLIDLVKMSSDTTGKLKLGPTKLAKYKDNIIEEKISEVHRIEAKQAYNGVRNRVERFYEKAGITGENNKKGGLLLQRIGKSQEGAKLANYGTLAEGYFKYLLDDHVTNLTKLCQRPKGNSPYYSHIFIKEFYEDYLSEVTNLSAIIEEDVKGEGNKEYAVKKEGAELPDLKQYKALAQQIVSTKSAPKDIETALKEQLNKESKINPGLKAEEIAGAVTDIIVNQMVDEAIKQKGLKKSDLSKTQIAEIRGSIDLNAAKQKATNITKELKIKLQ